MTAHSSPISPVQEADKARQVVGVLSRMESRFDTGRWKRGARVSPTGGNCLIGAIDEASRWTMPGVNEEVGIQLARRLPGALQPLGRHRPRFALALYNDVAGRQAAMQLVRTTREALGGLPPRPAPEHSTPSRATSTLWVADSRPVA